MSIVTIVFKRWWTNNTIRVAVGEWLMTIFPDPASIKWFEQRNNIHFFLILFLFLKWVFIYGSRSSSILKQNVPNMHRDGNKLLYQVQKKESPIKYENTTIPHFLRSFFFNKKRGIWLVQRINNSCAIGAITTTFSFLCYHFEQLATKLNPVKKFHQWAVTKFNLS